MKFIKVCEHVLQRFRYAWLSMFAFMLVGVFTLIALNFSFLNPIAQAIKEFSLTDIYYKALMQSPDSSQAITVVDMSKLYTRSKVAEVIYNIEEARPKVLGVDIVFQNKRNDLLGNEMLVDIARNFDNVVFAYYRQNVVNVNEREVHSFFTDTVPVTEGFTDLPRGFYGKMKRRVPLAGISRDTICHSFSSAVVNMYAGKEIVPLKLRDQNINFEPTVFHVIPADSVIFYPERLEGRIVLLGGINRLQDIHDTPLGKTPGTILLAYSIQTILDNKEVTTLPVIPLAIISFLILMITFFGIEKYSALIENKVSNLLLRSILDSTFVTGIWSFVWTALLLYLTFIIFSVFRLNINLGWAFAAIACTTSSASLFDAIYNTAKMKAKQIDAEENSSKKEDNDDDINIVGNEIITEINDDDDSTYNAERSSEKID